MLHSEDEHTVLHNFQTLRYETTQIPKQQQVSRQIPLHTLMPHACKLSKIDSVSRFPQYVLVGFQSETYTQRYFPQGRYYKTIRAVVPNRGGIPPREEFQEFRGGISTLQLRYLFSVQ